MKYEVEVRESGSGVCLKPEHHFGDKVLYHEVFEDKEAANKAASDKTKELYDKYDICKEWIVISKNNPKWIRTNRENIDGWTHYYQVTVYEWTEEEWEELAAE